MQISNLEPKIRKPNDLKLIRSITKDPKLTSQYHLIVTAGTFEP